MLRNRHSKFDYLPKHTAPYGSRTPYWRWRAPRALSACCVPVVSPHHVTTEGLPVIIRITRPVVNPWPIVHRVSHLRIDRAADLIVETGEALSCIPRRELVHTRRVGGEGIGCDNGEASAIPMSLLGGGGDEMRWSLKGMRGKERGVRRECAGSDSGYVGSGSSYVGTSLEFFSSMTHIWPT